MPPPSSKLEYDAGRPTKQQTRHSSRRWVKRPPALHCPKAEEFCHFAFVNCTTSIRQCLSRRQRPSLGRVLSDMAAAINAETMAIKITRSGESRDIFLLRPTSTTPGTANRGWQRLTRRWPYEKDLMHLLFALPERTRSELWLGREAGVSAHSVPLGATNVMKPDFRHEGRPWRVGAGRWP